MASRLFAWLGVCVFAGLLWVVAAGGEEPKTDKAVEAELKRLEGRWRIVAAQKEGAATESKTLVQFSGTRCTLTDPDIKLVVENTVVLDPSKDPKWIDLTNTTTKLTHRGIYELKGDRLKAVFSLDKDGKRPEKFETTKGSREVMYTYERLQDAKPDKPVSLPALQKDLAYADGGDQQKLDLYLPAKKGFATIVFTYGGGWQKGSRKSVVQVGARFQKLGYGCALLSHRLGPKDKFPAQIEDVAAGFAWVKKNIAARGGDPKRVFVMGHSSGAQLSLLLATDRRYLAKHELSPADIAGVVGLSSPVDLEPRADGKGFGDALLKGPGAEVFSRDPDVLKNASPIQYVTKDLPPVLLVVGDRDFPMLEGDARAFVEKARGCKVPAALYVARGRDHLGVVKALIEDRSPVMEQVLGFLKKRAE
jgi:uncharacterized protein (TIGR03067 family)